MTPQQIIKAIRSLEARCSALEAKAVKVTENEPIAIKVKRAYNRKNPNVSETPECQNLPTKN